MNLSSRGHVCILTTAHPTDDVRVNSRIANSLLESGYRVTWVGPEQSYFTASAKPDSRIRYELFRSNSSRWLRLRARAAASKVARQLRDVDWWYSPDPDAAAVAVRLARRIGGRVIFDVHEVFHGDLLDRWFPVKPIRPIREVVRRRVARTCRKADLVIGVSQAVLALYCDGVRQQLVIRNCAPRWFADPAPIAREPLEASSARLRVMHGKLLATNGTEMVLDAVDRLEPDAASGLTIWMSSGANPNSAPA